VNSQLKYDIGEQTIYKRTLFPSCD